MSIWQTFHLPLFGNSHEFRFLSYIVFNKKYGHITFGKCFDSEGALAAALAAD